MSRISTRVKRPILHHDIRIFQLLKGHLFIPVVCAYGQLEHFGHIAMRVLGLSVAVQQKKNDPGTRLMLMTVSRVADQVPAGLERIHSLGVLHCNIMTENLLPRGKDDPLKDGKTLVGSPY
ncbi:hypothetical protein F5146DRAFT_1144520 [Armillaria mellea]|nr:hypothetical protein F5146DRAFT_1144520 [Armillaria mellea]